MKIAEFIPKTEEPTDLMFKAYQDGSSYSIVCRYSGDVAWKNEYSSFHAFEEKWLHIRNAYDDNSRESFRLEV